MASGASIARKNLIESESNVRGCPVASLCLAWA